MNILEIFNSHLMNTLDAKAYIEKDRSKKYGILVYTHKLPNYKDGIKICRCKFSKTKPPEITKQNPLVIANEILQNPVKEIYISSKVIKKFTNYVELEAKANGATKAYDIEKIKEIELLNSKLFKDLCDSITHDIIEKNKIIGGAIVPDVDHSSIKLILPAKYSIQDIINYYFSFNDFKKSFKSVKHISAISDQIILGDDITYHIQLDVIKNNSKINGGSGFYNYITLKLTENRILIGSDRRYSDSNIFNTNTDFEEATNTDWFKNYIFNSVLIDSLKK